MAFSTSTFPPPPSCSKPYSSLPPSPLSTQDRKRDVQNPQAVGVGRGEPLDLGPGACGGLWFRKYTGVCRPLGLAVPPERPCTRFFPQMASLFLLRAQPPLQVSFRVEFQAAGRPVRICLSPVTSVTAGRVCLGESFFQGSSGLHP